MNKMPTDEHILEAARENYFKRTGLLLAECSMPDMVIGFRAGAKWALLQDNWIPVTERLPDVDTMTVAIVYENPFFGTMTQERGAAYYSHEEKKWFSELTGGHWITIQVYHVTHWQPLPELPKISEDETNS